MKKFISILIAVLLALTCIPFAFAEDAKPVQTPDCIKWEVSFDKEEYGLFDTALATVTMTNTSEKMLIDVKAQVYVAGLECSKDITELGTIGAGVSRTFTVRLKLSSEASGLNFLAKILLKIHEFFNMITGKNFVQNVEIIPISSFETRVNFGWGGKRDIKLSANYDVFENQPDSIEAAVEAYNKAAAASADIATNGYMTLESVSSEVLQKYISMLRNAISNTVTSDNTLPGNPPLTADDVSAASINSNNGKTKIVLVLKDQEDDYLGNHRNGDQVTRGIGTLGDFRRGFEEVGEYTANPDDTAFTYTYPVINVVVNDATGKIVSGSWSYCLTMRIDKAVLKLGKTEVDFDKMEIVMYSVIVRK